MERVSKVKKAILQSTLPDSQHSNVVIEISERGGYTITRKSADPLRLYKARGNIDAKMYEAGLILQADFDHAGIYCVKAMLMREAQGGTAKDFTEAQLEARDRWRKAMKAIHGADAKRMVIDVCCYGKALAACEYKLYRNEKSRMPRFLEAMEELVKHYGY